MIKKPIKSDGLEEHPYKKYWTISGRLPGANNRKGDTYTGAIRKAIALLEFLDDMKIKQAEELEKKYQRKEWKEDQ